jgi:DNA-binding LacI/PurR family transcriptional regulator
MNSANTGGFNRTSEENLDHNRSITAFNHPYNKTITMAAIAKAAGVSQGAISSLLNARDYGIRVSEKTRKRVFKACRDLGYIPNDLRAVVRMYPELGDLCLLVSSSMGSWTTDPFYSRVLKGTVAAISSPSHHITLAEYDDKADYLENPELLPHPIQSGIASKFVCIGSMNFSLLQALLRRDFPVTFLGCDVSIPGITTIQPDYIEASRLAIDYLLKKGHRHIAILSGPFGSTEHAITEMNRGVRLSHEHSNIPFDSQNIIHGDLTYKSGIAAMDVLFSRPRKPTAIFCLGDDLAAGALAQARSMGINVPEQLSILSCSNNPVAEALALTTIHLPAEEMGMEAVKDLEARVQKSALLESRKVVLPVHLVERNSCAALQ